MARDIDLLTLLPYIHPSELSYQEWINVGMALKEAGYSASDWDDWSRRDSARYHRGECARKWSGFSGSGITCGTLVQIARDHGCEALVTGENLGQVASQTMQAMAVTGAATTLPIFQPLIGMDKEEIVTIARKIGTMETSILPYEDCCTVFTPRHPKTKPTIKQVDKACEGLDFDALIERALQNTELVKVRYNG